MRLVQLESSGLKKPHIPDRSLLLLPGTINKNVGIDKEVFTEAIYDLATSNSLSVAHSLSLVPTGNVMLQVMKTGLEQIALYKGVLFASILLSQQEIMMTSYNQYIRK